MKFAALALAILLAVGSQAASLQADAPMDNLQNQLQALKGFASSIGDSVVTTLMGDINDLKTEVNTAELPGILNKSFQEILAMRAIIADFREKHQAEAEQMREKLEALVQTLNQKMNENLEQTKTALMPYVTAVQTKVNERLQTLKEVVQSYIAEFREPMNAMHDKLQNITPEEQAELRDKIRPLAEDIKAKLQEIATHISATVNKS